MTNKKRLVSLLLSLMILCLSLSLFGCGDKKAEFVPVEGFETESGLIFNVKFGVGVEEYEKTLTHSIAEEIGNGVFENNDELDAGNDAYAEGYSNYTYSNIAGINAQKITSEFVDGKLAAVTIVANAVDWDEKNGENAVSEQKEVVDLYEKIAQEMGFTRQEDITSYRSPYFVNGDKRYGDFSMGDFSLIRYDAMIRLWDEEKSVLEYSEEELKHLESVEWAVQADNDVIYYLSPDKTAALAIIPEDHGADRTSVWFEGENSSYRMNDVKFDPSVHNISDFNGGITDTMIYAPVYITYYDIQTVKDNPKLFGTYFRLFEPCTVEMLLEREQIGPDAFIEKYEGILYNIYPIQTK